MKNNYNWDYTIDGRTLLSSNWITYSRETSDIITKGAREYLDKITEMNRRIIVDERIKKINKIW